MDPGPAARFIGFVLRRCAILWLRLFLLIYPSIFFLSPSISLSVYLFIRKAVVE